MSSNATNAHFTKFYSESIIFFTVIILNKIKGMFYMRLGR